MVEQLIVALQHTGKHHDLGTVELRIMREEERSPAPLEIEGGCAYRLLRVASMLRKYAGAYPGVVERVAAVTHALAAAIAPYEANPSPTWEVMCKEMDWPTDASTANQSDTRHVPFATWTGHRRTMPRTRVVLIAVSESRIAWSVGAVTDGRLRRDLFPLTEQGIPVQNVSLCFALATGVFSGLQGCGAMDSAGRLSGDVTPQQIEALRFYAIGAPKVPRTGEPSVNTTPYIGHPLPILPLL